MLFRSPNRPAANRSSTSVTVDNLIRRALRVSDPANPAELAKALLQKYSGDAEQLKRERAGSPIQIRDAQPAVVAPVAGRPELAEARNDLDRDLDALINESQLKDIQPELRGWAGAIRTAATNGLSAARMAMGPNERDRALAARLILTDYARLSRYLAALTSYEAGLFCRLAQSCDIMGALILVTAGEALTSGGVTGTSVILQSPASELQHRREAVLNALRNLVGSTQTAFAPNEWQRGPTALRQLYRALEDNGATDLRAYLDEGYLSGIFDEMIVRTTGNTPDGMRALGATSIVTTAQLERFVHICQQIAEPESPQLANFLSTIQFFTEAFGAARAGYRLTYIARPPLLFYGLSGASAPDHPTLRLLRLIALRGQFAQAVDCYCCGCDGGDAEILTISGKALYDIDRAIDLLLQGSNTAGEGESELRAAAYGFVVEAARNTLRDEIDTDRDLGNLIDPLTAIVDEGLLIPLANGAITLFAVGAAEVERRAIIIQGVICLQHATEARWRDLVRNMSAGCRHDLLLGSQRDQTKPLVTSLLNDANGLLEAAAGLELGECAPTDISIPDHYEVSLETLVHNIPFGGRNRNTLKRTT